MISFICGFFIGGLFGVFVMCAVALSKGDYDADI
jgi:hypothetical protein